MPRNRDTKSFSRELDQIIISDISSCEMNSYLKRSACSLKRLLKIASKNKNDRSFCKERLFRIFTQSWKALRVEKCPGILLAHWLKIYKFWRKKKTSLNCNNNKKIPAAHFLISLEPLIQTLIYLKWNVHIIQFLVLIKFKDSILFLMT